MEYIINSPLEQFEIQEFVVINSPILSILNGLSITKFSVYIIIVLFILYIWQYVSISNIGIIPSRYTISIESLFNTINNMVVSQIGLRGQPYIPFVYSIFIYILISNLVSMVPYNFAIMAQVVYTISLSISIWIGVTILGLYIHKLEYFSLFVPSGTSLPLVPVLVLIEAISNISRSLSLGLRLGANILAGHLLMVILGGLIYDFMASSIILFFVGFLPLLLVLGIMTLETAIAGIQAYVFCILLCNYVKDAIYLH